MDLKQLVASSLPEIDKAALLLLQIGGENGADEKVIADHLENAGSAKINRTRLKGKLKKDARIIQAKGGFKIAPRAAAKLREQSKVFGGPSMPEPSQEILDSGLFANARSYTKHVVDQINVSYDNACFDCTAVMIRRLFETMVIDTFEHQAAMDEITDSDGAFLSLKPLIGKLKNTSAFTTSRQTKEAAMHLKDVGDWSAHNRRHRARKSDIDSAAKHLRLASSDLLHLSGQD